MSSPSTYEDLEQGLRLTLHEPDARLQNIPETVLQDVWARVDFDTNGLTAVDGARVRIVEVGSLNRDGGPDFSSARLIIDGIEWVGDVELHRTSGEWLLHRHHEDPRYDRVVLHVTMGADRHTGALRRADGTVLPEIVLLPRLRSSLRELLYRFFAQPAADFPCAAMWQTVPHRILRPWLRLLAQERLRDRLAPLIAGAPPVETFDDVLYRAIFRALGYAPNADAMEQLARRLPLRRMRQLASREDAEALLLGVAGLLPDSEDLIQGDETTRSFIADRRQRFEAMPESAAAPMRPDAWQFARLRPANTPARRIAQAAAMVAPSGPLSQPALDGFRSVLRGSRPLASLRHLLTSIEVDPYWETHTRPDVRCRESPATIGRSRADAIITNAMVPALLYAAEREGDYDTADQALDLLMDLPAPDDHVIRLFAAHGPSATNALEAQGLHHLLKTRCRNARCLSCTVGRWLLDR